MNRPAPATRCGAHQDRPIAFALCALLLVAAAARDYSRNLDWRDDSAYSLALVRVAPNNPKARLALGVQYSREGKWNGKVVLFFARLAVESGDAEAAQALVRLAWPILPSGNGRKRCADSVWPEPDY